MKKIISVVALTMVMIMTMAVSVFAEPSTTITAVSVNGVTIPTKLDVGQVIDSDLIIKSLPGAVFTPGGNDGTYQMLFMALTDQQKIDFTGVDTIELNGYTWASVYELNNKSYIDDKPIIGARYAMGVCFYADSGYLFDNSTSVTINDNDYSSSKSLWESSVCVGLHDLGVLQSDGSFSKEVKKGADTSDSSDIALFGMLAVIALAGAGFAAKKKFN